MLGSCPALLARGSSMGKAASRPRSASALLDDPLVGVPRAGTLELPAVSYVLSDPVSCTS